MAQLDWIVLGATLVFIVFYGIWKTRGQKNVDDYVRGGKTKWWTIGLSVMATQASAITFLSTPGQAYHDGMGFVQFYFGLPLAMIVICMVFIPLYHRLKVYTAYEFLESRFDLKTRSLAAILFLIQRGLSAGITIFAPAIILSAVLGWNLNALIVVIGILVILYTVTGGTKAVNVTQKQQMFIIFLGMFMAFFFILDYLPEQVDFSKALKIAGVGGKMEILDFDLNTQSRYTFWSGITGGLFLALAYFGTDQSQVQRYLSGKSVRESQLGLIFNAMLKIPMQFFILLVGVMVFVFYQFNTAPLHFNPAGRAAVSGSATYQVLDNSYQELADKRKTLQLQYAAEQDPLKLDELQIRLQSLQDREMSLREEAKRLIQMADSSVETNDKDYVFIHFILNNLPRGLIGLLLAVILSAAMSSTASELNALGTITALDLYRRNTPTLKSEMHYLNASKGFTLLWGLMAIGIASIADLFDNLIQLVNIIGSIFYGNVLGIFLLAFFIKYVKGNAVFTAALITQVIVIVGWYQDWMSYLWLNAFGCGLVIAIALAIQLVRPGKK